MYLFHSIFPSGWDAYLSTIGLKSNTILFDHVERKGKVARVIAFDGLNNGLNSRYTCMVCYTCVIRISLKWDSHLTSFASRWKVYLTFLSTKQSVQQGFSKNTFKIHTPTSNTYMQFVSWKPFRNFARRVTIIWVFTTLFVS